MDIGGIWFFFLTDKTSYHKPQSGTKNGTTQIKRFVMMWIKWRVGWKNPIDYNELRGKGSLKWSRWEECPSFPRSNLPLLFQITDSIILIRCLESTIEPSKKGNGYQFGSYMNTNLFPTVSITPIPEFCQE